MSRKKITKMAALEGSQDAHETDVSHGKAGSKLVVRVTRETA
jgi:hypothetical protein